MLKIEKLRKHICRKRCDVLILHAARGKNVVFLLVKKKTSQRTKSADSVKSQTIIKYNVELSSFGR